MKQIEGKQIPDCYNSAYQQAFHTDGLDIMDSSCQHVYHNTANHWDLWQMDWWLRHLRGWVLNDTAR